MKVGDRVTHIDNMKASGIIQDIDGMEVVVTWEMQRWSTGYSVIHHPSELRLVESTRKGVESA